MPFHFPLEVVLRFRRGLEHRQELMLLAANHEVGLLGQQIAQLDFRLAEARDHLSTQLQSGLTSAELEFEALCRKVTMEQRETLRDKLLEAQAQRDSIAEKLRQARRNRETLETLRTDQLHTYQQAEARRDQRLLDDALLLRRAYLRRS